MAFNFEGLRLYVANDAPLKIKGLVESHGGVVVRSADEADIRIVNHNRPTSVENGYSYLWVLECVRQGRKIDEAQFLVSAMVAEQQQQRQLPQQEQEPVQEQPRNVRRSPPRATLDRPRKRTRTEFTPADDKILLAWILQNLQGGPSLSLSGNALYKKLAARHPQHSFHSWRERWLKRLANTVNLSDPRTGQDIYRSPSSIRAASPRPAIDAESPSRQTARKATAKRGQEAAAGPPAAEQGVGQDEQPDPADDTPLFFMDNNDYVIVVRSYKEWYRVQKTGKNPRPTAEFFEGVAKKYPQLTADEWRQEYMEFRSLYLKAKAMSGQTSDSQRSQAAAVPAEAPAEAADAEDEAGGDIDDDDILLGLEGEDERKKEFLESLEAYNNNFDVYVPSSFLIGGRFLETYSLWTAVRDMQKEQDQRDWGAVVRVLGLDADKHPSVEKQLAAWYAQNLEKLEVLWQELLEAMGGADDGDDDDDDEIGEEDNGLPEQPAVEQSPGSRGGGLFATAKRLFGSAFQSSDPAAKDQRAESPSKRVRFSAEEPVAAAANGGDGEDSDEADGSPVFEPRPQRTPTRSPERTLRRSQRSARTPEPAPQPGEANGVAAEPETQDFAYDPNTQHALDVVAEDKDEDEQGDGSGGGVDATPSQQLRTEIHNVDAIPVSLSARPATRSRGSVEPPVTSSAATPRANRRSLPASFARNTAKQADEGSAGDEQELRAPLGDVDGNAAVSPVDRHPVADDPYGAVSQDSTTSVVDRFVSMRYPQDVVVRALRATGNAPGLAGVVMERLLAGGGIPGDMAGVWTSGDDRRLLAAVSGEPSNEAPGLLRKQGIAGGLQLLESKHGAEQVASRVGFLAADRAKQERRLARVAAAAAAALAMMDADVTE